MRRATIDFAHYVHENVSILCRSACPPPAAGDKEPVHCACLICVTEVVCAKIDVAFHSTVCGPCWGLLPPCVSQFTEPGPPRALCNGITGLTSIQMLALHAVVVVFLFVYFACFSDANLRIKCRYNKVFELSGASYYNPCRRSSTAK